MKWDPPPPRKNSKELAERARQLCDSQDPQEIAMGACSIMDLPAPERENAIRTVLRMNDSSRPVNISRNKLSAMRRAQDYAVQSIVMVPDVEARFGLIRDLFHSITASNQAIRFLERLYKCLEIKGDRKKQSWHYQDALVEYLLTNEEGYLTRTNGEDAVIAGVLLLDRVHDVDLRKKLLLYVMNSHPIRNCLMRETHEHPDLLGKIEDMAAAENVEIPPAWFLPCHSRNEDRMPARASNIMDLPEDERHLAIHRLLATDDDEADTPEKISPMKVEKLERALNYAIQNINNVPEMEKRPDLIRHAFMNPFASRQALMLRERLFSGLVEDGKVLPDQTLQYELMDFLLDERHLDRANGEDAIVAGVLLLNELADEEKQREYLESVLDSTRIRDCLLRERYRHIGLMNGLENLAFNLRMEIPKSWQVMA